MSKFHACVEKPRREPQLSFSRSQHTPAPRSTRVHLIVIVPILSLASPSSHHLIVVVLPVRPSRTHRRLHPIRYHAPLLACSYCLLFNALERPSSTTTSESAYGISIRHLRTTGCTLVCATAADAVDGRAGSAMVGGAWHPCLGFWREWLGRVHLSGMYPSLLHNRGFDVCSTSSLHHIRHSAKCHLSIIDDTIV